MSLKIQEETQTAVKTKGKIRWPLIMVAAAVGVAGTVFLGGRFYGAGQVIINPTETAKLVLTDLHDSVSANGMVESAERTTIYSTMAYTVQEVLVEVGDRVESGQLLCKLDDQNIRDQIQTQQAGLDAAVASGNAAIKSARDNYNQFKSNLENGKNTSIINAENALTNAQNAYITAQSNYDRYFAGMQAGENTTLLAQENALRNARTAVENAYDARTAAEKALERAQDAQEDLEENRRNASSAFDDAEEAMDDHEDEIKDTRRSQKTLESRKAQLEQQLAVSADPVLEAELATVETELVTVAAKLSQLTALTSQLDAAYSGAKTALAQAEAAEEQGKAACDSAEAQLDTCDKSIVNAEAAYETASKQYQAAITTVDNTLADHAKNVDTALAAYVNAQKTLDAVKTAAQDQLQTYKNTLNSAYANAGKATTEVALEQLQADLTATEITAPKAGTVTAVYAEVGSAGSGLLFVIEDTENFVVTTSLKDYDIAAVQEGTPVNIRSDATGDDVYQGQVTYIAPTATKNALGLTDTGSEVTFAAEVKVDSKDTRLRIGLNVRLEMVVAQAPNVLAVPYEAVYQNANGVSCILLAEEQADGTWILREQEVELGLETDLDIAVKSKNLTDGMTVIGNPEKYLQYVGQTVSIGSGGAGSAEQLRREMMGGY